MLYMHLNDPQSYFYDNNCKDNWAITDEQMVLNIRSNAKQAYVNINNSKDSIIGTTIYHKGHLRIQLAFNTTLEIMHA